MTAEPGPMPATLEGLNNGWPFSDGPNGWPVFVEHQAATKIQPEGLHLCCGQCRQSVTRLGSWAHTLASLKPQIAGHVMQVHAEQIGC